MIDAVRKWLDEVKERCEKATPGPWKHFVTESFSANVVGDGWVVARCETFSTGQELADAKFIAHARGDIPRLLAIVERLGEYARHKPDCVVCGDSLCELCSCGFDHVWKEKAR